MTTANVLVADDDESIRLGCSETLSQEGYRVETAADGSAALQLAERQSFDLALVDIRMPGLDGLQVIRRLKHDAPHTAFIVITGYASVDSAVTAMRLGASDYLAKPFPPAALAEVARRTLEQRRGAMETRCLRLSLPHPSPPRQLLGSSPAMGRLAQLMAKAGPSEATVLLIGETGVGKELVARALHQCSPRCDGPFVPVDCAALVPTLFESELFGHVKGAFTGATRTTVGKFELANRGTLFLDEIGNIQPAEQVKLLRGIQERVVVKVGGTDPTPVDVRIIAATNNDLQQDMKVGRFRKDLFFRLSVIPIRVPALRERPEDIPMLAKHFVAELGPVRGSAATGFTPEALEALRRHHWPGNVRELENTVERGLVLAEGELIGPEDLLFHDPSPSVVASPNEGEAGGRLASVERDEIIQALERFEGQITRSADYLGIARKTLRDKIRRYHIERP